MFEQQLQQQCGGPGSGRRSTEHAPATPAPELRPDYASVDECLAWAYREMAAGRIPSRVADTLISACKGMITRLRTSFGESELEDLRELVNSAETIQNEVLARERRVRGESVQVAQPQFGRVIPQEN